MDTKQNDAILEFKHVCKSFPGVKALDDISFSVRKGSIHCIVGENGAGKSTLMKVLNGLYRIDSGDILFEGRSWHPKSSAQARLEGIAMIYQELNVVPEMTVVQNLYLGREMVGKSRVDVDDKGMMASARAFLKQQGLEFDLTKRMRELSIADAQMIEIVKSISCNSRVILMDEPTSSLTEHETQFLFKKIFELKQEGITIIFISHKLEEIFNIADYISIFRDGKHIITGKAEEFTRASLIEKMVGREMKEVYPPRTSQPGKVLLEVKGLSRKGVFDNISFHVCKGEILGMSGLVGAGRTEIARAMIGLDTKDSGDVFLDGEKLDIKSINDSIRNGIAMVSEDRHRDGLILQRDIEENISLVALRYSFGRQVIPMKKEKSLVLDMMRQFSIKAPSEATGTWTLSGGNQQKVVLAKWMSLGPKVLIMDEPTRGIDVKTKYEIYKMMNTFTDAGLAIIMINSDMEELLGMSDRILVIRKGTIAGELTRAEANPNAIMSLAVGGKQ